MIDYYLQGGDNMEVYALRNKSGEYISMDACSVTKSWLKASKFDESQIEERIRYIDSQFKLIKFKIEEVD